MSSNQYDVIIIGTGAGGATLAYHLASSGKKILILERGGFLPKEQDNWDTKAVFTDGKYKAKESWLDKDEKEFHPWSIVIVSCGAINSAALLLCSGSDKHPNGLANSSDMVGRHYMCHNNSAMLVISKEPNPTLFGKTIALNDFYFGSDDWDYPLGHIQMLGKSNAEMLKGDAPSMAPRMALDYMAGHSIDFWMTSEDLPVPENRVALNKDGRISLHYKDNNMEGHKRLQEKLKGLLKDLGCREYLFSCNFYLGKKIPLAGTAHQCGTIRFGTDPKTSVLDVNCKAHDLDNLYVVDNSFFVSSTAVNPGLTIMANALRVGDRILERI